MALPFEISAAGLTDLDDFANSAGRDLDSVAIKAINFAATRIRTQASREIRAQVRFSASYLDSKSDGNLTLARRAQRGDMSAEVRGRFRATSMRQFIIGAASPTIKGGKRGTVDPLVQVQPNGSRLRLRPAFVMKLRQGNAATRDRFNLGLAMRLRPGEPVRNKKQMIQIDKNLYLLYGPSVDQVFRTLLPDLEPLAIKEMQAEFTRLFEARIR